MPAVGALPRQGISFGQRNKTAHEAVVAPRRAEQAQTSLELDKKIITGLFAAAMEAYERAVCSGKDKIYGRTDDGYDFYARFSSRGKFAKYVTIVTVRHPETQHEYHQAFNNFGDPIQYEA